MRPMAIIAAGVISPLGEGPAAYAVGALGARPETCVAPDSELAAAGLRRPNAARVALPAASSGERDRAQALLDRAWCLLLEDLERARPGFRELRLGLVLGTSSGGLGSLSELLAARARGQNISQEMALSSSYFGPLRALDVWALKPLRVTQVLAACASSTVAMGIGCRWLDAGICDLVIAGGYDALTTFAAAGFEALGATTASVPRPFRKDRDGLALGEGAALVALARASETPALGYVLGFGVGCDAVHVTAPDRTGAGLARAARAALLDAEVEPSRVDLISAHATATPFNDSAEGHAIAAVIGATAERVVVHPFKAIAGHTLGAAGTLETLAALSAASRGILPAAYGEGELENEFPARLCGQNQPGNAAHLLKLSTAFGGANAALVLSPQAPRRAVSARPQKRVRLRGLGEAQLTPDVALIARATGIAEQDLERYDRPSLLCLSAVSSLLESQELTAEARKSCGVIVGTMSATLEVNEMFAARLRERGARGAEPRRFPATSPNLAPGRAAIAFGLQGPNFSVGAGPAAALEALLLGIELLAAGDAQSLLVVAVEDVGPVVREVFGAAGLPQPEPGAIAALLDTGGSGLPLDPETLAEQLRELFGRASKTAPGWPLLKRALSSAQA
ncbi:MAG TPA: beta-ketoacyl synthase N-terminal-like domain-containing protein [Polyangiaceae bacterium]|nr:beta-ketoacyl synthase N-terminal-like domain-containing protein [Polyangiaceae bacterium]